MININSTGFRDVNSFKERKTNLLKISWSV